MIRSLSLGVATPSWKLAVLVGAPPALAASGLRCGRWAAKRVWCSSCYWAEEGRDKRKKVPAKVKLLVILAGLVIHLAVTDGRRSILRGYSQGVQKEKEKRARKYNPNVGG
ncbi:uncharacterized protein LY79DRAFT_662613 [Colletotrichum navitas]|uniref:Uncharacterized protein n=1 Tax=Colletotrichum navitas TaxID=681940 RepID=A0AAD8PQ80_9PEZI|nr:uncharacterized protein LY79DRAFT_662613 [Colletotrichum navitas]KAK1573770.1 hypothetical protein LY79DRAFT_662613 [Colletotrichum navitas]